MEDGGKGRREERKRVEGMGREKETRGEAGQGRKQGEKGSVLRRNVRMSCSERNEDLQKEHIPGKEI